MAHKSFRFSSITKELVFKILKQVSIESSSWPSETDNCLSSTSIKSLTLCASLCLNWVVKGNKGCLGFEYLSRYRTFYTRTGYYEQILCRSETCQIVDESHSLEESDLLGEADSVDGKNVYVLLNLALHCIALQCLCRRPTRTAASLS